VYNSTCNLNQNVKGQLHGNVYKQSHRANDNSKPAVL